MSVPDELSEAVVIILLYCTKYGIAVRTGHHCAQPILRSFGLEGVVRPTLALYNSPEDIDRLVRAIRSLT